jgi:hypothetical protein
MTQHPEELSQLIHSSRTSISIVLGLLEDLKIGETLTEQDLDDAVAAARNLREVLERIAKCARSLP